MSREAGLALLGLGAFVAPGVIVLLEWARTVMGILSLAPGVVYIPNGLETFYLALTAGAIVYAVPVTRSRIARGDYRLSKCFGTFLAMLIVWKVIDVTLLSEAGIEALESSGMTENIVLSIGTFGYAFVAALVFWSIAVRPQQRLASAPRSQTVNRPLMPVAEARQRILADLPLMPSKQVSLPEAHGRVLAVDVAARVTQPPLAVSAMDGYAVRAADVAMVPANLAVIGAVPAGGLFEGEVGAGQAVRIFTGAPLPAGADAIIIQEDTERDGDKVTVTEGVKTGRYVRRAGLDFAEGDVLLTAGTVLSARDIGLAAAMNHPWLQVRRRPRVALLATGDEIHLPGEKIGSTGIISSNTFALEGLIRAAGGEPVTLGIAVDDREQIRALAENALGTDMLVTTGGASVGEHDLVQDALADLGLELDFWQIAMRPGKPLMSGRLGAMPMLGFPGNPVSSMVCGILFLMPALAQMLGTGETEPVRDTAVLGIDLEENDRREDYLRATLAHEGGRLVATPFEKQDSSMFSRLAAADCLLIRPPHAPAAKAGDTVDIVRLDGSNLRV